MIKKMTIPVGNLLMVGVMYYPENYYEGKICPAIIIDGTITTVKEQMAANYAVEFAANGFIALTFDHRGFGVSEGEPRFLEDYKMKIEDIKCCIDYLLSKKEIAPNRIGLFGIGSAAVSAFSEAISDKRVKSIAAINPWIVTQDSMECYFGGKTEIEKRINEAKAARVLYEKSGKVTYVPIVSNGDKTAVIFGEMDYFQNSKRGNIPQWSGNRFNVMSWEKLLKFFPMSSAEKLTTPVMIIAISASIYAKNISTYFELIRSAKKDIIWISSTDKESDFYDMPEFVDFAVERISGWFVKTL